MGEYQDISGLMERAKELECLYLIDEALAKESLSDILMEISSVTPLGFRNNKACVVTIVLDDVTYAAKPEITDGYQISCEIMVSCKHKGYIQAAYPRDTFSEDENVFLLQEEKLLKAIANKIARVIYQKNFQDFNEDRRNWETIVKLLQNTDQSMLLHICEKMLALLARTNQQLLDKIFTQMNWVGHKYEGEINYPLEQLPEVDVIDFSNSLFCAAGTCLDDTLIFDSINLWIYQGKTYELIKTVNKRNSDVKDIQKALNQYLKAIKVNEMSSNTTQRWLFAELIRRFLTEQPKQIDNARKYVTIEDFCDLLDRFICSPHSVGRIGGKATGFFLANQVIKSSAMVNPSLSNIKVPATWYLSSEELDNLLVDNGLDELNEHKYKDILEIRLSYPQIIQTFKNAKLSPYVMHQLNHILEECENKPLIIRSSSLLEDQLDSAFSGKYKSLFVTNSGTKSERLKSLLEGILEVYASMFNPDSIQYRKERNLLDSTEKMGIMIQEVVGFRVGPYYFPLYAGVAFSNNELRWSPRIKREDGLIRLVMGLGTRAVDRVGDDYPILISPGQPKLSVNQASQEIQKYSPQMLDAIDMEENRFVTLSISELIKEYGNQIPYLNQVASVLKNDFVTDLNRFTTDLKKETILVTFEGLINKTIIVEELRIILGLLQDKLGYPVDIEFASDGQNFYLLQCRPQGRGYNNQAVAIPSNIATQDMIFTANRYISNGKVTGIKTVVYVDPEEYARLDHHLDLQNVGKAVSELNRILPRRSFILMGPGRWGSRGDIRLGVQVTYSDINNTAMLIEVARQQSKYQPDLSFGTHFFQDLVEADIKYLPLYPEDKDTIFNNGFFTKGKNVTSELIPDFAYLENVIKVIHVEDNYYGKELAVLMNADLERAIAYLVSTSNTSSSSNPYIEDGTADVGMGDGQGWKWRHFMAEKIAAEMDMKAYGVKGIYLFGSTNNCTARLNSDIDLLIHIEDDEEQKERLSLWLNGWSKALSEMNFLKTGYHTDGLLDVHYVTDQDIKDKNSYAVKINSIYDPALPLRVLE